MDSSKISVGATAEAVQYNDLRKDALLSGFVNIETIDTDDTDAVGQNIVGDSGVVEFFKKTSAGYFDVEVPPNASTAYDWTIKIAFDMSSSMAGNVRLALDYASIANAGDATPTKTQLLETVACPSSLEVLKVVTLSTIKIPAAAMVAGNVVTFKISRLGADALDTHTGTMRLFALQLFQSQI